MYQFWNTEFWRLAAAVAGLWFIGLLLGIPVWGIVAGLLLYIFQLVQRFRKFADWVSQKLTEPEEFGGAFDELAFRIYRIRMRSRKRKKRMSELLRRWQDTSGVLPDAAVLLSTDGNIAWFNQTASSMLGLKSSDQGKHIGNLLRNPRFIHYLVQGDYTEHLEIVSPLDNTKTYSIRITPYGSGQRLMLVSDVTHIQRLMTMRRDFIANVSHELRTPLTVIMGYLETLKDDEEADLETLKTYLSRIETPALRMKSLVEDLLLLSKLDTGAPSAVDTSSRINVAAMLKNIQTESEQLSQGRHDIRLEADSNVLLKGSEKEIHSAFINLVTNAIRYTPDGGHIVIRWSADNDGARLCVNDDGPGIPIEHIPRLTERFYRIDVGRSRSSGGTGLGLAIVKQVLRRHDGEFTIESEVGKGSEFCCVFPMARIIVNNQADTAQAVSG